MAVSWVRSMAGWMAVIWDGRMVATGIGYRAESMAESMAVVRDYQMAVSCVESMVGWMAMGCGLWAMSKSDSS